LTSDDEDWTDLSNLSAVSFWVKDTGELRLKFNSEIVSSSGDWGHFGKDFKSTKDWKLYKIFSDEIAPMAYSQTEADGIE